MQTAPFPTNPYRVRPAATVRPSKAKDQASAKALAAHRAFLLTRRDCALKPEEVKALFRARGLTFAQWARAHGYTVSQVVRLVNGFDKGTRGIAHEIAVKLGMKLAVDDTVLA